MGAMMAMFTCQKKASVKPCHSCLQQCKLGLCIRCTYSVQMGVKIRFTFCFCWIIFECIRTHKCSSAIYNMCSVDHTSTVVYNRCYTWDCSHETFKRAEKISTTTPMLYLGQFSTGSRKVSISQRNSSTNITTHCTQLLVRSLTGFHNVNWEKKKITDVSSDKTLEPQMNCVTGFTFHLSCIFFLALLLW